MRDQIIQQVKKVIADMLEHDSKTAEIRDDHKLLDLQINSLSFIKAIVSVEAIFDIEFTQDELDFAKEEYATIESLAAFIEKKMHEAKVEDKV